MNIEKDMLYKYGARLNNNTLIDKDCGPIYIPGHPLGIVDWYFYPLLQRTDHPITKNIDPIKSEYASTVEIVNQGDADVQKTVLLKSSGNSLAFKSPVRINYSIVDVEPNFNENGETDLPVALMMEGRFTSAFENRLTQEFTASPDFKTRFKSDSTKMLVVSDGDIIRNEVETKVIDGETRYRAIPLNVDVFGVQNPNRTSKYIYGNRDFVLNSIDYMMDDNSLIDVRAKTITLRVLDTQKAYEEKSFWKILNIGFPLLCIFILGLVQFFLRKKKFAKTV